ncbi:hypothetical protein BH11ARM1_BH11ARM1_03760 [soil metagenome]
MPIIFRMKFTEKLMVAPAASFHVLDEAKAKRLGGKTMYIPSVVQVRDLMNAIPYGHTITVKQARQQLADAHEAEITCPGAFNNYWKWLARSAEHEGGLALPWWRLTKDGKANPQMPGGVENHSQMMKSEQSG